MTTDKRPLKVFPSTGSGQRLCHAHIIPLWDAERDPVRGLYTRLTQDGVDTWLDKEKLHGEQSVALSLSKCRTILPPVPAPQVQAGQDWELEIRKAV